MDDIYSQISALLIDDSLMNIIRGAQSRNIGSDTQSFQSEHPYFTVERRKEKPYSRRLDRELVVKGPESLISQFCTVVPPPIDFPISDYVYVDSNTVVQMRHLKLFNRPDRPRPSRIETQLSQAIKHVERLMNIPDKLPFPAKSALSSVPFYGKRSAGYYYWCLYQQTREKANYTAQMDAERAYDELMAGIKVKAHMYRICGRGKATLQSKLPDESLITGRLIFLTTQRDLKLNGITENALTECYLDRKYPVALGLSWWHGGCDAFVERLKPYDTFYCLDAKKFDANIDSWMIKVAINLFRKQYIDGMNSKYDTYWDFVYAGMVDTPIFRDDGIAFEKHVGSSSGHSHNTLIQSIITLIIAYSVVLVANPGLSIDYIFENTLVESLGDDNIIAVRGNIKRPSALEMAKISIEHFGIDWSGKKSFQTSTLVDQGDQKFTGVQFLGKYFRKADPQLDPPNAQGHYLPYRPTSETFLKLLFATKNFTIPRRGVYEDPGIARAKDTYLRALGNWYDSAGNETTRKWIDLFLDWLEIRLGRNVPTEWRDDDIKKFQHGQRNNSLNIPDCKRISYEQWVSLVTTKR